MQPNKVLSKEMRVTPLQSGEHAIYRLIAADEISPNMTTEDGAPVKNNPARKLSRTSMVYDIETQEQVLIGNVTGTRPVKNPDGTIRYEDVTTAVNFVDGNVIVQSDQQATYQYLERHNGNRDNIFRDRKKPAFYYRVNPRKRAMEINNKNSVLADALMWAINAEAKDIKALNDYLPENKKLNLGADFEVIKADLFKITNEDPIMVMKASSHTKSIVKIAVMESEMYNIIYWMEDKRTWFFNDEKQEDIAVIEIGNNRIDALVEYLMKDKEGNKMYKRIEGKLRRFLNIGNPNK